MTDDFPWSYPDDLWKEDELYPDPMCLIEWDEQKFVVPESVIREALGLPPYGPLPTERKKPNP